jgi:hypothetical protein
MYCICYSNTSVVSQADKYTVVVVLRIYQQIRHSMHEWNLLRWITTFYEKEWRRVCLISDLFPLTIKHEMDSPRPCQHEGQLENIRHNLNLIKLWLRGVVEEWKPIRRKSWHIIGPCLASKLSWDIDGNNLSNRILLSPSLFVVIPFLIVEIWLSWYIYIYITRTLHSMQGWQPLFSTYHMQTWFYQVP